MHTNQHGSELPILQADGLEAGRITRGETAEAPDARDVNDDEEEDEDDAFDDDDSDEDEEDADDEEDDKDPGELIVAFGFASDGSTARVTPSGRRSFDALGRL